LTFGKPAFVGVVVVVEEVVDVVVAVVAVVLVVFAVVVCDWEVDFFLPPLWVAEALLLPLEAGTVTVLISGAML
jgi:hypothetical protein